MPLNNIYSITSDTFPMLYDQDVAGTTQLIKELHKKIFKLQAEALNYKAQIEKQNRSVTETEVHHLNSLYALVAEIESQVNLWHQYKKFQDPKTSNKDGQALFLASKCVPVASSVSVLKLARDKGFICDACCASIGSTDVPESSPPPYGL